MTDPKLSFDEAASRGRRTFLGEFVAFLRDSKKWWLIPIFVVLGLVAALVMLGGTALAPFIYTLF
jgi:hypothetical protein